MKDISQVIADNSTDLTSSMSDSFNRYNLFRYAIGTIISFQIANLLIWNLSWNLERKWN